MSGGRPFFCGEQGGRGAVPFLFVSKVRDGTGSCKAINILRLNGNKGGKGGREAGRISNIYIYVCVYFCVFMYVCMYVRMCVCTYVFMYMK